MNDHKFNSSWNVWIHKNSSKDWTINGYDKIFTISTISDFWNFMNNFNKLNYMDYQFFIMRGNITPLWEDPDNKNGGAASIRMKIADKNLLSFWEDICLYTLNENICSGNNPNEFITGVSFNLKNDLTVFKLWNNSCNDISKKISKNIMNKFKIHSVLYIRNRPNS